MKNNSIAAALLLLTTATKAQLPQLGIDSNEKVIKAMTTQEKARLIMGLGMNLPGVPGVKEPPDTIKPYNPVDGSAGVTYAIPRLGIPAIVLADGPAGLRINPIRENDRATYYCTAFPIGTLLASTWDETTVRKVGHAIGHEVKEYGADVLLAPALNIHRNILGGRNFEYYSEDPVVSGKIAAAYITGVQENGVGTSIKHFAANNHEANRMKIDVEVGQRALREIYLRGFEIATATSKPWTLMSSYNKLNGTYTSQNYDLITTILQKEWNYDGLVMTDWFAGDDGAAQMNAGNHMIMPGTKMQYEQILEAVKNEKLKSAVLDANVNKVLNLILRSPTFKKYKYSNKPDLAGNAVISKVAASEGFILLKNEKNALPIKTPASKIALFGNCSYHTITGGTGSGDVHNAYTVTIAEGLSKFFTIDKALQQQYISYLDNAEKKIPKPAMMFLPKILPVEKDISADEAAQLANSSDAAIFTIGRTSGEFVDRILEGDYYLTNSEKRSIKNISETFHAKNKKLIVLLNVCGVIEMKSWQDLADAILLVWQPGQEAGNAVKDVVNGTINPSGKLATTIPVDYQDAASSKSFPGMPVDTPTAISYTEGIYTGYRYFEKFNIPVLYPFGYGLSYTVFSFTNLKFSSGSFKDKLVVTADISNTGNIAGKEVVQLYISAPATQMGKPVKELKGFVKTSLLQPGKMQTVTFEIGKRDIASFDETQSAWVAEAGNYTVQLGSSSANILLHRSFSLPEKITVLQVNNVLKPKQPVTEMK
jgi:beta-glucosidase